MSDTWMKIGANHSKMKRWAILEWKKGRTKKVSITWTKTDPRGRDDRPPCPVPHPSRFRRPWGNDVNDASRCVDKPRCVCAVGIWDQISASHGVLPASQFTCKMLHNQVKLYLKSYSTFLIIERNRSPLVWDILTDSWGPHELESWNFYYEKNSL